MNYFTLLFLIASISLHAQSVSTYFLNSDFDVDDAMVFDAAGNLYGSNFDGDSVYKISPTGEVSTFVSGLMNPNGLALDSEQNLYVAEYSNNSIHKYNSAGDLLETFAVSGFPSGLIKDFDSDDMIFTIVTNNSVNRLATDGTITEIAQGAPLMAPVGLAFDEAGSLFIGNFTGRKIHKWQGDSLSYIATVPATGATSNPALGFITYGNGSLWGTSFGGHKIYEINPTAVDEVVLFAGAIAGNIDGPVAEASFSFPNGIIYKSSENTLYVSEFSGIGNIRKIDFIPLGTNESQLPVLAINVYPNPVVDQLSISSTFTELPFTSVTISIMDNLGRKIYEKEESIARGHFNAMIDVAELGAGNYKVVGTTKNGMVFSKSFVIMR